MTGRKLYVNTMLQQHLQYNNNGIKNINKKNKKRWLFFNK